MIKRKINNEEVRACVGKVVVVVGGEGGNHKREENFEETKT
jgi:hypothetical protein